MTTRRGTLGTFGGVFTPSVLTILGLILFLRVGYVVGTGGVLQALAVLGLATTISVLTSISLSAIATNRRVRGGGDYYLISRSLGVSFGGALGLVLFVAQAVSVGFYCVGFAEGIAGLSPQAAALPQVAVAGGAALVLFSLAYLGADLATRFQFVIMLLLGAALASLFVGGVPDMDPAKLEANWIGSSSEPGFWVLFAVFFPAVTGFTQGVSMSGDLKDPATSLPAGTFAAVGLSTIVYAATIILLGSTLPEAQLIDEPIAMKRIAAVPWLIDAGVLAATLSSALASFLGAPRILQALAADHIFRRLAPFAVGHGPSGNPRRAVLLTALIAGLTIAAGNLNAIAGLVSMFFLISYGLLNYATYVEATAASPSFRPRFRFFHARASLAGTFLCAAVMIAIDPVSGLLATAVLAAIYQYVRRTAVPARWRDSRRAYRYRRVREGLREIAAEPERPSDWQPQILLFTHGLERRERVLRFGTWIAGNSGIVTATVLIEGQGLSEETQRRCAEAEAELRAEIEENGHDVYPLAIAAPDLRAAMATLVQSWGAGPLRSNTVLVNWLEAVSEDGSSAQLWYARMLAGAVRLHQHVIVLDTDEVAWERLGKIHPEKRRVDVWWFDAESSRLCLLLAHLMTRTEEWADARLRVLAPVDDEKNAPRLEKKLVEKLGDYRIDAHVEVVLSPTLETVRWHSDDAALVFLPLRIEGMRLSDPFGFGLSQTLAPLPIVALVAAAEDVRLSEERAERVAPEPEDSEAAQAAEEEDATESNESPASDDGSEAS